MKVVVTGSRHYTDANTIRKWLLLFPITLLIHGGCRGADKLAEEIATDLGIKCVAYYADWSLGKQAGPIRNQQMVDARPDLVIAFPLSGSIGTFDCIRRAKKAGIPVLEISDDHGRYGLTSTNKGG